MSIFNVERDAVPVGLLGNASTTLTVLSGGTLYYADNSQVSASSNQGSLTSGNSATFTNNVWIVSASASSVSQSFTAASTGGSSGGAGASFGASWIDICNPPSAIPTTAQGGDPTASIQAALNYFNTNNINGRVYWSKPVGTIAAAATSGSGTINAHAYTYNGQILVPARAFNQGPLTITIMGLTPTPNFWYGGTGYGNSAGGNELISSLTTAGASVFDAIPGDAPLATPLTAIVLVFQDCVVRAPSNPQCNGVDGNNLVGLEFRGECRVDTVTTGVLPTLTGTGFGVRFPPYQNGALSRVVGSLEAQGYPTNVISSEHFTADELMCSSGLVGWAPGGNGLGHSQHIGRLVLQGNSDGIKPTAGGQVKIDVLDIGDVGAPYTIGTILNDPSNNLIGEAQVSPWNSATPKGFPVIGGKNFRFRPWSGRKLWLPADSFTRIGNLTSNSFAGASDLTHDVWDPWNASGRVVGAQSDWSITGGVLKAVSNTSWVMAFQRSAIGRTGASRVIRVVLTLAGTYNVYIPVNFIISGIAGTSTANDFISVNIAGGAVSIFKSLAGVGTTLAQSAASVVAAGTYTFDVIVSNPAGAVAPTIRVRFGTGDARSAAVTFADALTAIGTDGGALSGGVFTLSAAQAAQMLDANQTDVRDGVGFFHDNGSSIGYFQVGAAG